MANDKESRGDIAPESLKLMNRKLEIMARILELKAENRKLDMEFVRTGDKALATLAVMVCW